MTKEQLQKELQEKVKAGVKPSHLKRSKSLSDLPANPAKEIFAEASEAIQGVANAGIVGDQSSTELKAKITQLEDQILELRLAKIKEFGEYYEKKKDLQAELDSSVNYGTQEITRLENKLRTINKKKLELQQQLSQAQGKNARLELQLIEEQNQETSLVPNSDWWIEYGPMISLLLVYLLSVWLLSKNTTKPHNKEF